jgi:hypothetical protein
MPDLMKIEPPIIADYLLANRQGYRNQDKNESERFR